MTFSLDDAEFELIRNVPAADLVSLAADLDMVPPAEIDRRALVEQCVPRMLARARADGGLPLSKYDAADVQALSPDDLRVLAAIQGTRSDAKAVLRAGARLYRAREKHRLTRTDPYAYFIPLLLAPLLRLAREEGLGA